nr:hypothetical protein [Gammaproteobacteria bacterium]
MRWLSASAISLLFSVANTLPAHAQTYTDVAVGSSHVCAIDDSGVVDCATPNFASRYAAPDDLPLMVDISAGDQHTCGIDIDGQAVCWGATTDDGTFDLGYFNQMDIPDITQPLVSLGTGDHHTCAIDATGRAWCWGLNSNLQTEPPGDGYGDDGAGYIKVDGGLNLSCGIETDGDISCWTNDSQYSDYLTIAGPFVDLDIGFRKICAVRADGTIYCALSNIDVPDNGPYTQVAASRRSICGLKEDGTLDCAFDQFVDETVSIPSSTTFTLIESGAQVFSPSQPYCGITSEGFVVCTSQFDFLNLPGSGVTDRNPLDSANYALIARRYSRNQIELFWNFLSIPLGEENFMTEVYRNDVLVDTTANGNSWYDPSEQTQNPVTYKVRAVDQLGNAGRFSATVTVDIETGAISSDFGSTRFPVTQALHTIDSINFSQIGGGILEDMFAVTWSGSIPGSDGLKGYEVRLNNNVVYFGDEFVFPLAE